MWSSFYILNAKIKGLLRLEKRRSLWEWNRRSLKGKPLSKCGGDDSTDKLKQIPPRSVSAETREEQRALTAGRLLKEILLPGTADEVGKKTRLEYINSNWYSLLQRYIPAVVWSRRSITDACVPQTVLMLSFCIFPTKLVNFRQDFPLRCCRETNILVNKIAIAEFCSTFGQVSLPFSPELGASKVLALVLLSMKPPSH